MTPEELLRPRIKVIAPMPFMVNKVGDLLNRHVNLYGKYFFSIHFNDGSAKSISVDDIMKYPHLFKLLNWWEERKREDLPEYVKCINTPDQIHKADKVYKVKWGSIWGLDDTSHPIVISTNCYIPATLTDYQNQSK